MASIDGLISGMSTTDMIAQLMKVEAIPQSALRNKVSAQSKAVTAYQSVNSRFASLLSAARAVTTADNWGAMKATSSSDAVAVSAKPGAAAGSLSFTVDKLAAAHTVTFTGKTVTSLTDATAAPVLTGATIEVMLADGSGTTTVTPADRSLQAVVKSINDTAGAAYKASAVQVSPGRYTIQLTALATGGSTAFGNATAPAVPGDPQTTYIPAGLDLDAGKVTTTGQDAVLTVGSDPGTQFTVTSKSNTFADVLPGVTITVAKKQTDNPVTVSLTSDAEGVAAKVQALIENANVALAEIASQTRVKSPEIAAGALAGDSAMRRLGQDVIGAVSGGAGALGSLSQVGVSVTRDGKLAFDKQKFLGALAADPVKTQAFFDGYADVAHPGAAVGFNPGWDTANGLGRRLEAIGAVASEGVILPTDSASKVKEGILTGLVNRRNDQIRGLNDQVAAWDNRLSLRKTTLERQWSGLEVALGKLKSQSSWLSGQLAAL
jgi:flagellar hook-associated protein 2